MTYVFGSRPGDTERFVSASHFQDPIEIDVPYQAARSYVERAGTERDLFLGVLVDEDVVFRSSASDSLRQSRRVARSEGTLIIGESTNIPLGLTLRRKHIGARVLDYAVALGENKEELATAILIPTIKTFRHFNRNVS